MSGQNRAWALDMALRAAKEATVKPEDVEKTALRYERYADTGSFDEPAQVTDTAPKTW